MFTNSYASSKNNNWDLISTTRISHNCYGIVCWRNPRHDNERPYATYRPIKRNDTAIPEEAVCDIQYVHVLPLWVWYNRTSYANIWYFGFISLDYSRSWKGWITIRKVNNSMVIVSSVGRFALETRNEPASVLVPRYALWSVFLWIYTPWISLLKFNKGNLM